VFDFAGTGGQQTWIGAVTLPPNATTGLHHHGRHEVAVYVVKGRGLIRWGERLEYVAEAGPGDFIHVPPYVPHQEINASDEASLSCVLVRTGQEPVVVNLDGIDVAEPPEAVHWTDDLHTS